MSCITSADGIKLWLLICLVNLVIKSQLVGSISAVSRVRSLIMSAGSFSRTAAGTQLVDCQLSRDVTGYKDSKCHWYALILVLSLFNSPLLLAKLSAAHSFSCS